MALLPLTAEYIPLEKNKDSVKKQKQDKQRRAWCRGHQRGARGQQVV